MQTLEANPLFVCVEVKSYNTDTVSLNCYFLIRAGMAIVMKVGHVILMILLVKMFERSKMVKIATGLKTELQKRYLPLAGPTCQLARGHRHIAVSLYLSGCSIQQRPQLESVN